jgi:hypothetical protein
MCRLNSTITSYKASTKHNTTQKQYKYKKQNTKQNNNNNNNNNNVLTENIFFSAPKRSDPL